MKRIDVKKTKHGIHKSIKGVNLSVTTSCKTLLSPGAKKVHYPVFVRVGDTVMAYGKYKAKKSTEKATNFMNNKKPAVFDNMRFPLHNADSTVTTVGDLKKNKKYKAHWDGKKMVVEKEKVTWEGGEWLRSINDDLGFTFLNRLAWHLIAWGILVLAVVTSAYILKHGLVCAPASFYGKTVVNCMRK